MCTYLSSSTLRVAQRSMKQHEATRQSPPRAGIGRLLGALGPQYPVCLADCSQAPRMGRRLGLQWAIWASMALTETALPEEKPVTIRNLQPHIWSSLHIFSSFETMPHSWAAAAAFSAGTSNKLLTYVSSSFVADKTAVLSFPSLPRKLEGWEQNQFQGRWVAFEHWEGASQRKTKLNFFESFGGRCTDWFNYQRINGFKTGAAGSEAHRPNPTCWEPVGCTFPPESRQIWWIEMAHMQISRPSPLEFPLGNGDPGPRHFLESWILWVAHLWPNAFFRHIGRYLTWSGGSAGFHFLEFRVIIWDHL